MSVGAAKGTPPLRVVVTQGPIDPKAERQLAEMLNPYLPKVPKVPTPAQTKAKCPECQACNYRPRPSLRSRSLNVHHVRPRAEGGTDHPDNLLVLCARCHQIAHSLYGNRTPKDRFSLWRRIAVAACAEDKKKR